MASEVGNGQVAIFPTFKGFRRGVMKEIEGAEKDGSARFRKGFSKSSTTAGRDAGVGFRKGFQTANADLGKQVQADVTKAARAVSSARLKEQDAAGRVRVAEAQLAEARKKHAADSSQVIRAEERLASEVRKLEAAQDATRSASDRLAAAQQRLAGTAPAVGRGFAAVRKNLADLMAPVTALSKGLGGLASKAFTPVLRSVGEFAKRVTGPMRSAIGTAVSGLRDFGLNVANRVVSPLANAENVLRAKFGPQIQKLKGALAPVGRAFKGAFGLAGQAISGIGAVMGPVASGIGRVFSTAMDGVKRVAGDAAQFVGSTFKAAGAAVAATLGIALTKGFGRLEKIDTARTKLTALGNNVEDVDKLMTAATDSVDGTAFGLDEAANAAAAFAAAKVPIDKVGAALNSTAATAAVAGTDMQTMGDIFAKVAATGKLDGATLMQLQKHQVAILPMIAEHYKVTGEEARKMVSEGKVSFEDFVAITGQLGDAAKVMGTSFKGMASNVGAALSRIGAVILGPAFEGLKTVMPGVINALKQVQHAIEPLFATLGEKVAPVFERIGAALSGWKFDGSGLKDIGAVFAPLLPVIGAVAGALGGMMARLPIIGKLFAGLSGPLGLVIGLLGSLTLFSPDTLSNGIQSLVDGVTTMLPKLIEGIADTVSRVVPVIAERLTENLPVLVQGAADLVLALVDAIVASLPALLDALVGIIPGLVGALLAAIPALLDAGLQMMQGLIQGIVTAVPMIITAITDLLPTLLTTILGFLPQIIESGINLFLGLVTALVAAIPQIITALLEALPLIFEAIVGAIPLLLDAGIQLFLGLVDAVTTILPDLLTAIVDLLPAIVESLVSMIPTLLAAAVDLFTRLVLAIPVILPQLLTAIVGMLPQIVSALISLIPTLLVAAIELFTALIKAIPEIIPKLIAAVKEMGPRIVDAVKSIGPKLLDAGKAIIRNLIDGVKSMFGKVGEAFGGLMDFVKGFFPHSPAKRGPFSGAGWTRVREGGESLVDQFQSGVDAAKRSLQVPFSAAMSASAGGSLGASTASGGPGVLITGDVYTRDEDELVRKLQRAQRAAYFRSGALVRVG
ncbi:tape measure protein [Microbacterium soli]|uniref:Tape measure protein N-terminal domain-containing protein n=1 Tax=Microbacterium soli TaxID=446075 RepID=A0ABP7NK32_9MICO